MKKIAILQSNYIPWKGYFDMIAAVDEFVIFDDAQFTKNDWRNRNKIKTPVGTKWISIPTGQRIDRRIRDVSLKDPAWQEKHWRTLEMNYRSSACFEEIATWLQPLYLDNHYSYLSQVNRCFIESICGFLDINTRITNSWDYESATGKLERLTSICIQAGASQYISGPSARSYIDEDMFAEQGIQLAWFDYSGYSEYPQLWGDFEHGVTVLDLLFNCGKNASSYMKNVRAITR